jgi:hypothetical protein
MQISTFLRSAVAAAAILAVTPAVPVVGDAFLPTASAHENEAACDLRVTLNQLLGEHVTLAASATGAALGGRNGEFEAAAAALDTNSVAIADAIGWVYGEDAGATFLPLWRTHIGFFVDYTVATAESDMAAKQKAVDDLTGYASDFGAFLESANPNLTKDAVAELVGHHVMTLAAVVDAQASMDYAAAYTAERTAYAHMQTISDALASAIAMQFPDRFM